MCLTWLAFWQRVEERRTHRVTGCARCVAHRSLSYIAGLLGRPVSCPRAVTWRLGPLASIRERLRSLGRGPWAPIVKAFTFDRQCRSRTRHRVAGDLAEFGPAEFDCRGVVRDGVILLGQGRRLKETPVSRSAYDRRACSALPAERLVSNAALARSTARSSPAVYSAASTPPLNPVILRPPHFRLTYPLELSKLRVEHTRCTECGVR